MLLYGDYHTHTIYSHGKGDIIDNARVAQRKGLKQLAITDHGFDHKLYSVDRNKLPEMKEKILQAEKQTGLDIFLGVEANFVSLDGTIDVLPSDMEMLEVINLGFHRFVKSGIKDKFDLFYPNILHVKTKSQIKKNTDMVIKALDRYPINTLVHPNYGFQLDIARIAPVAREKGTAIEINGRKNCLTDKEILLLAEKGVKMILNSDAHHPEKVGEVNVGLNIVERLNIPHELIVNLDKNFLVKKRK